MPPLSVAAGPRDRIETAPPLVELVLYISGDSPRSLKARHRLEELLAEFEPLQFRLEVHDLMTDVGRAEEDHVVFTPTLVKRSPEPRAWLVGDNLAGLAALLAACGVEKR
jgi:hypothetical protein